jgi:POT family proton-dependent oligopeptide transporter
MTLVPGGPAFAARAVARLSLIEFWERYSFYTLFALLTLFVAAPAGQGGMGWANSDALRFFGLYLLVVQTSPVIGGLVADRWLGKRAALRVGAAALALGHALLAVTAALPLALRAPSGLRLCGAVAAHGGAFGGWTSAAPTPELAPGYVAVSVFFYGAVALIALGNALYKPILTVVIGRLPFANQAARGAAFTSFFLYVNIGGLVAVVLGGWLSQRFGWSFTFAASALGMLVSILTMIILDRRYIAPFLRAPPPAEIIGAGGGYIAPLAALLGLVAICASFSYQSYGFVALFTAQKVARDIGDFRVPPAWFTALNPITILVLSPILLTLWRRGRAGAGASEVQRIAAGLITMSLGFAPLVAATLQTRGGGLASPLWVAGAIMLIAASELLYAPAALAAATRVAPPQLQTLAVGTQGAAIGIGGWLSGQLGALAFEFDKTIVMGVIAVLALAIGIGLYTANRSFKRIGL